MVASTALGLLPFLGAGQTHREGKYKRNVDMALHFLGRAMHQLGNSGSLWEPGGRFYGHGLAAIALCEAYGMTRDSTLQQAAQRSVDFIVASQDPVGGGWRYFVDRPDGDTSVVGWQLMALKSAHMAYLKVPSDTIRKAGYFLDSVQTGRWSIVWLHQRLAGDPLGHFGDRSVMPDVHGLATRPTVPLVQGVGNLSELGPSLDNSRAATQQHVLQLLCDPSDAPLRRL